MARIRSIKPEFWSHPVIGRLDDCAKCLAVALLSFADDEGYFYADPSIVRNFARPFDEDSSSTRRALEKLMDRGWIVIVEHPTHGQIGKIVNFEKHQVIDRKSLSKIKVYFDSSNPRRMLDECSTPEQGTGNREQGTGTQPQQPCISEPIISPSGVGTPVPPSPAVQAVAAEPVKVEPKPKTKKLTKRSQKLDIALLSMSDQMADAFQRVADAWPKEGWNYATRSASPRKTNLALAAERFKAICDDAPIRTANGPLTAEDLADAALAWVGKRRKEAGPAGVPCVPCIENFFSADQTSKKHWQNALLDFFGVAP